MLLLPSCFLPDWKDRDWVNNRPPGDDDTGDDDTSGDDDATDDDDDTGAEIAFTGTTDIYINLGGYQGDCLAPTEAELTTADSEIDGEAECLMWGYAHVGMQLDAEVIGTTVDGIALVYDEDEYINVPLSIPVDGSYDAANGTSQATGFTTLGGIYGEVTLSLTKD